MAHVHTFGVVAPAAAGIIQLVSLTHASREMVLMLVFAVCSLGATSCFVTE
jgi:hypothetical protein